MNMNQRIFIAIAMLMSFCSFCWADNEEAYAVYYSRNQTLRFYYDNQAGSREEDGVQVFRNFIDSEESPKWSEGALPIVTAEFSESFAAFRPTSTLAWFSNIPTLTRIVGLQYLNTSKVTNMGWMFNGCKGLKGLNLTNFDTGNVTKMTSMFYNCENLTAIYVGLNWSTQKVTASDYMFNGCDHLVGGEGTAYDVEKTDKSYAHIDGGAGYPGYFSPRPSGYAFYNSTNNTLTFYNDGMMDKKAGDGPFLLTIDDEEPGWNAKSYVINKVVFDESFATARPVSTFMWFAECMNLETIENIKHLNTSKVTNMEGIFMRCGKLSNLDVSNFDTRNVTNMPTMFSGCEKLTTLDLSSFKTSQVENMAMMFSGCTDLKKLYLSNFDTRNVLNMIYMFQNCSNLETIYSGDWNTDKLEITYEMFFGCSKLKGEKGSTCPTNAFVSDYKSYLHVDGGPTDRGIFTSVPPGISTGVAMSLNDNASEGWYTIDGRKLNGQPTKKGVYIHNGKVVMK